MHNITIDIDRKWKTFLLLPILLLLLLCKTNMPRREVKTTISQRTSKLINIKEKCLSSNGLIAHRSQNKNIVSNKVNQKDPGHPISNDGRKKTWCQAKAPNQTSSSLKTAKEEFKGDEHWKCRICRRIITHETSIFITQDRLLSATKRKREGHPVPQSHRKPPIAPRGFPKNQKGQQSWRRAMQEKRSLTITAARIKKHLESAKDTSNWRGKRCKDLFFLAS